MKLFFYILLLNSLILNSSCFAIDLFEEPVRTEKTKSGLYQIYDLAALGDVKIRTIEIPASLGKAVILKVTLKDVEQGAEQSYEIHRDTLNSTIRVTATIIDFEQSGRDGGIPSIRITITDGVKTEFRRVVFPAGFSVITDKTIQEEIFHMKWTLKKMHPNSKENKSIECEMNLEIIK